jgi:CheY-like chemotaxis protein
MEALAEPPLGIATKPLVFLCGLTADTYRVVKMQLAAWGVDARFLQPAPESMEVLKDCPRAIVLCGSMESTENRKFFEDLHRLEHLGTLRSVLLVPLYGSADRQEGVRTGFKEFLTLPLRPSQLRSALEHATLLRGHGEERTVVAAPVKAESLSWKLLLVEDNPVNQRVALAVLGKLGYQADLAGNGAEAVTATAARPYDLVLMDCQMPVMDGFEATRRIREAQAGARRVPILAMTANAMQGDRERCLQAGMDDYLPKPVTLDALRTALQRWLPQLAPKP